MMDCTLVFLAAGIGSRFGGIKQLEHVGPNGEILMEYSVRDAVAAGVNKILFLIRHDIEADFREVIAERIGPWCEENGIEITYAYQERDDLPGGFECPADRQKPWGTGQAMLACKDKVKEPFIVLNADDYYGKQAFRLLVEHLNAQRGWALAGFRLANTLSCHGGVTRGICQVDESGKLTSVLETRDIKQSDLGTKLDPECCVSMNMWGFTPEIFTLLDEKFLPFLQQYGQDLTKEFLLPEVVDELLKEGKAVVQVLPTDDRWYGMTYREDIPIVKAAFANMQ